MLLKLFAKPNGFIVQLCKVFTVLSLLVMMACSNTPQEKFCKAVSKNGNVYTDKLKSIIADGHVDKWEGTVRSLWEVREKGVYLEVQLSCGGLIPKAAYIIKMDSPLYTKLGSYTKGSKIMFSGHFEISPDQKTLNLYSLNPIDGKPEFLFKFTEIHP